MVKVGVVHSWRLVSDSIAEKIMDRSAFIHRETGIPIEVRGFFDAHVLVESESMGITLTYKEVSYEGTIRMSINGRTKMSWHKDLADIIAREFSLVFKSYKHESAEDRPNSVTMGFERIRTQPLAMSLTFMEKSQYGMRDNFESYIELDDGESDLSAPKGRMVCRMHLTRECDQSIISEAKRRTKHLKGELVWEI